MIRRLKSILERLVQHETGICHEPTEEDDVPVEDCQFLGSCVSVEVVEENNKRIVRNIKLAIT